MDADTGIVSQVAGNGTRGFGGDNGPATSAQLNLPQGIAVDSAGNVYIADSYNNRIRKVANGIITTFAGDGVGGLSGDNGPATSAELSYPRQSPRTPQVTFILRTLSMGASARSPMGRSRPLPVEVCPQLPSLLTRWATSTTTTALRFMRFRMGS